VATAVSAATEPMTIDGVGEATLERLSEQSLIAAALKGASRMSAAPPAVIHYYAPQ
jgi:hypothetical protein